MHGFINIYSLAQSFPHYPTIMSSSEASTAARKAVASFPDSDIEIALEFCQQLIPEFVGASNDRLVKVGRSLKSLIALADHYTDQGALDAAGRTFDLDASLEQVLTECRLIVSGKVKVPKVRFGKTELQMPVVTLGCMRFQQEWGPRITNMNMVKSNVQDNLVDILKTAIVDYGINHIETARGYGSSELQLGVALKQLMMQGLVKREDLIIQTKINPTATAAEYRAIIETSMKNLQIDYIDLFSIHGLNTAKLYDWVFEGDENCLSVVKEYQKAGKIKHIGFSTHGPTELILKAIETDEFDYVNIHYQYFGSYTASGGGVDGKGNLNCAKLCQKKDMGIFIISPFDKGGALYLPSRKLRSLTLPEMEPMAFESLWVFNHHQFPDPDNNDIMLPQLHTFTVGAGRASDLDQPAVAAYLHATEPEKMLEKLKIVHKRLEDVQIKELGEDWVNNWWKGLPKAYQCKTCVEHNQLVWIYNSIKAFGMFEFGKMRYGAFEGNGKKWDDHLSNEENIAKLGYGWGYVPGLPLKPNKDYEDDLVDVPSANFARVKEAEKFVYKWCRNRELDSQNQSGIHLFGRTFNPLAEAQKQAHILSNLASNFLGEELDEHANDDTIEPVPWEWESAYDMRPWPEIPSSS